MILEKRKLKETKGLNTHFSYQQENLEVLPTISVKIFACRPKYLPKTNFQFELIDDIVQQTSLIFYRLVWLTSTSLLFHLENVLRQRINPTITLSMVTDQCQVEYTCFLFQGMFRIMSMIVCRMCLSFQQ